MGFCLIHISFDKMKKKSKMYILKTSGHDRFISGDFASTFYENTCELLVHIAEP